MFWVISIISEHDFQGIKRWFKVKFHCLALALGCHWVREPGGGSRMSSPPLMLCVNALGSSEQVADGFLRTCKWSMPWSVSLSVTQAARVCHRQPSLLYINPEAWFTLTFTVDCDLQSFSFS
jgi:hypothetical protein